MRAMGVAKTERFKKGKGLLQTGQYEPEELKKKGLRGLKHKI